MEVSPKWGVAMASNRMDGALAIAQTHPLANRSHDGVSTSCACSSCVAFGFGHSTQGTYLPTPLMKQTNTPPLDRSIVDRLDRGSMDRMVVAAAATAAADPGVSPSTPWSAGAGAQGGGLPEAWGRLVARHQGAGDALAYVGVSAFELGDGGVLNGSLYVD